MRGRLGLRLQGMSFVKVFTSPLQRAIRTCELAGFGAVAEVDEDLVEWGTKRSIAVSTQGLALLETKHRIDPAVVMKLFRQ